MNKENDNKNIKEVKKLHFIEPPPIVPYDGEIVRKTILGQCLFCKGGVSDQVYALIHDEQYVHFECSMKKIKEKFIKNDKNSKNLKAIYTGSNNFSVFLDKGDKNPWEMVHKMSLKEIILEDKN